MAQFKCLQCGKVCKIKPFALTRGRGKFCSKKCKHESQQNLMEKSCPICGITFSAKVSQMLKRVTCSLECRSIFNTKPKKPKNGIAFGSRHWNWKGGKTEFSASLRSSLPYKEWRKSVFERDNYTCVHCGARNKKGNNKSVVLNADHIIPLAFDLNKALDINNGRTLCIDCHKKTDSYGFNFIKYKKKYDRNEKI